MEGHSGPTASPFFKGRTLTPAPFLTVTDDTHLDLLFF